VRPKTSDALLVLCLLIPAFAFCQTTTPQSPSSLLKILLSQDLSDEEWKSSLDRFQKLPAKDAVRALFPEMAKGIPGGFSYAAYNCSEPLHDRKVPAWGEYCVVHWLWCETLACVNQQDEISSVLLELWTHPISRYGQSVLLSGLCRRPEAEEKIVQLFRDDKADQASRRQAAICLLGRLQSRKYHEEVVAYAQQSEIKQRDSIFRALSSPYHLADTGIDPAVVCMGFDLMDNEAAKQRGQNGSYFAQFIYVNQLNLYLGTNFVPDSKLPSYMGSEGIERWYRESVENARTWWAKHRQEYTAD
jgi:hypothetical protein